MVLSLRQEASCTPDAHFTEEIMTSMKFLLLHVKVCTGKVIEGVKPRVKSDIVLDLHWTPLSPPQITPLFSNHHLIFPSLWLMYISLTGSNQTVVHAVQSPHWYAFYGFAAMHY